MHDYIIDERTIRYTFNISRKNYLNLLTFYDYNKWVPHLENYTKKLTKKNKLINTIKNLLKSTFNNINVHVSNKRMNRVYARNEKDTQIFSQKSNTADVDVFHLCTSQLLFCSA